MFCGSDSSKVDDKGRWKLPSSLAELLGDQKDAPFFITISADKTCGELWPIAEWQKQQAKLARASSLNKTVRAYRNLTGYFGRQEKLDAAGRILLPKRLRDELNLDGEVAGVGQGKYIALYNEKIFAAEMVPEKGLSETEQEELDTLLKDEEVE